MKDTSTVASEGDEGQVGGRQRAGVQALDHGHARVLAQARVDLAVGDVDGGDPRGAALEQAVGEAAGGGADVDAVVAGEVDPERVERVSSLIPPRETNRGRAETISSAPGSTSWLGRSATGPSVPILTSPARTAPAAAEREGKSPARRRRRRYGPSSCPKASARPDRRPQTSLSATSALPVYDPLTPDPRRSRILVYKECLLFRLPEPNMAPQQGFRPPNGSLCDPPHRQFAHTFVR